MTPLPLTHWSQRGWAGVGADDAKRAHLWVEKSPGHHGSWQWDQWLSLRRELGYFSYYILFGYCQVSINHMRILFFDIFFKFLKFLFHINFAYLPLKNMSPYCHVWMKSSHSNFPPLQTVASALPLPVSRTALDLRSRHSGACVCHMHLADDTPCPGLCSFYSAHRAHSIPAHTVSLLSLYKSVRVCHSMDILSCI